MPGDINSVRSKLLCGHKRIKDMFAEDDSHSKGEAGRCGVNVWACRSELGA